MKKQQTLVFRDLMFCPRKTRAICFAALFSITYVGGIWAQCPPDVTVTAASSSGATGTWQAPSSGGPWLVEITATGAGGGGNAGTVANTGGSGATVTGKFVIQNGQSLFAIAGGPGVAGTGDNGGGGGGGSGVVNCGNPSDCATGTILILAAGGNGAESSNNGLGGSVTLGGSGSGGGGGGNNGGGGGGGLSSAGTSGTGGSPGTGGGIISKFALSSAGNGTGTDPASNGGQGMAGGGGGGSSTTSGSGGGGGYTGAVASNTASATSYNLGGDAGGTAGATGGGSNNGSIVIKCLGPIQGECFNEDGMAFIGPGTSSWTAPATGGPWLVRVSATGAGGGGNTGNDFGGGGATVSSVFTIQNGETLFAISGGPGESPANDNGGGGGGGSGVVNCGNPADCANGTILVIASGGSGAEGGNNGNGGSSTTGGAGGGGAGGGTNGGGGGGGLNAGGGNGGNGFGGSQVSKTALSTGGTGNGSGVDDNDGGNGMGAGGGGGSNAGEGAGGGGGHTGGAASNPGTGATSFIHASGQFQTGTNGVAGAGSLPGVVTITCLGFQPSSPQCDGNAAINLSGPGFADWTAPTSGGPWLVHITAKGGGGGDAGATNTGGSGATMTGIFTVQNGQTIRAIAGGDGGDGNTTDKGGGGGGSGVVNCGNPADCSTGTVLIIAAGGNGGEDNDGSGGSITTGGNGNGGGGGSSGSGGGGGGGGLNTNGSAGSGTDPGSGGAKVSLTGPATGGAGSNTSPNNKGGDGMGAGGGGGHTGAAGDDSGSAFSFNSGSNQINTAGTTGTGSVVGTVTVLCLASLPVELINFKALIRNQTVELLWSTASEKNNLGFDVERSADNQHWTTLGFVPGHGTTTDKNDYSFPDDKPLPGINYYRLKQQDFNGKFEYTPIVVADIRSNDLQFDIYPNPSTSGELSIRTVSRQEGGALLEVYDWVGFKVHSETLQMLKGTMVHPLSMTTFPKGTYTARLEMPDGTVQHRKIVLQ